MYTSSQLENPRSLIKNPKNIAALEKAMNPDTFPRKIEELSHSHETVIRLFAALHPNASMYTLTNTYFGILRRETDEQVIQAAKFNIVSKLMAGLLRP